MEKPRFSSAKIKKLMQADDEVGRVAAPALTLVGAHRYRISIRGGGGQITTARVDHDNLLPLMLSGMQAKAWSSSRPT